MFRQVHGHTGDDALRLSGLNDVYIHEFETADVVRSDLVRRILERYDQP